MSVNLASKNLDLKIITASHVLCLSCIWIALNLRWMIFTIRSISLGEMGRVLDCSLNRFITWVVNSLQAWESEKSKTDEQTLKLILLIIVKFKFDPYGLGFILQEYQRALIRTNYLHFLTKQTIHTIQASEVWSNFFSKTSSYIVPVFQ